MSRFAIALLLFVIACLASGVFGAAHNQVSYSVSPEYFTKYKFHQFQISPELPDRIGAALVGWHASWWMGIVLGVFLIPFGLLIRGTSAYFVGMLKIFVVVLVTTSIVGLLGLAVSFLTITPVTVNGIAMYGNEISDPVSFVRAGTMHNSSYAGGLIGIITGGVGIVRTFLRHEESPGND